MALKRKPKMMSILLTLAMLLMLWPGVAVSEAADTISVSTAEELIDTVTNAVYSTISIDANITLNESLSIGRDVTLTSDNGKTLDAGANKIAITAGEVTFNGNLQVTGSGTTNPVVQVNNGSNFTLDGNAAVTGSNNPVVKVNTGATFTLAGNASVEKTGGTAGFYYYAILNDGTINIEGGTVASNAVGIRMASGELTVTAGTITGDGIYYGIFGSPDTDKSCTLNISGGTIGGTNDAIVSNNGLHIMDNCTANISGSPTIKGNSNAVFIGSGGMVNIFSGTFTGSTNALSCAGTANLTSGTFNGKVRTSTGGTLNITSETVVLDEVYYNDSGQSRLFLDPLPAPITDATTGTDRTIALTGMQDGLTYSIDNTKTSGDLRANISNNTVTIDPSASGIYELVLTATASGQTFNLTIPVTVTGDPGTIININAITGVTAPVTGAPPVPTINETEQYTGTINWSPAIVDDKFAGATAYTATITLIPKTGFTLTSVTENFFTVADADTVTNAAGSGVVTAVFPATAVQKADDPAAPAAPTLASKTHNSVTLAANLAHQFSKDNGQTWQDSNVFTGLSASTQYTFVARVKETATNNPSSASTGLSVTTNAAPSSGSPSSGGSSSSSTQSSGVLVTSDGQDTSDAGVTLNFPPGAVESDIRVQVREASLTSGMDLPADSQLISQVVDIVKNKSGDFSEPVTITMSFNKSQIDPDKYDIKICYFDEANGEWVELDNIEVDPTNGSISGEVTHFTKFAVIATLKASEKEEPPLPPAPQPEPELPTDLAGHWAKDSIAKLINARVISGYPDGTFQPDKTISRAEFTVMLVKALQLEPKADSDFKDTAAHWARESVSTAAAHGLISGYDQNTFRPDHLITREQAAVIIARAAQLEAEDQPLNFTDAQLIAPWALPSVTAAVSKSYLSGYPDNSFRPQGNTTRAEAAIIIAKLL